MRNSVRLAGVAATAAAMLALGSPAFATDGGGHDKGDKVTAVSKGGDGGHGGDAGSGKANIHCSSVGAKKGQGGDPTCNAQSGGSAAGGESANEVNNDSKKSVKGPVR